MSHALLYPKAVKGQTFAERLSGIMEARKLTIAQVAAAAEVDSQTIRRWTTGQTEPNFSAAMRLCNKLDVDPFLLAFGRARPAGAPAAESSAVAALDEARKELQSLQVEVQALTDAQMKRDQQLTELLVSQERLAAAQQERDRQIAGLESTIERLANLVEHLQTPQ